jgi:hypothetical protein
VDLPEISGERRIEKDWPKMYTYKQCYDCFISLFNVHRDLLPVSK